MLTLNSHSHYCPQSCLQYTTADFFLPRRSLRPPSTAENTFYLSWPPNARNAKFQDTCTFVGFIMADDNLSLILEWETLS